MGAPTAASPDAADAAAAPPRHTLVSLQRRPNSLASSYREFRVAEQLLFTGHSHQAWPDVARQGMLAAFADAADLADRKWQRAFAKAERVRAGYRVLLDDPDGHIALAANTHDAVVRFISALPLRNRPRLISTDGEFHTLRRQLDRLAEAGVAIDRVAMAPTATVGERLIAAVRAHPDDTAAVLLSTVTFATAEIVPGLRALADACEACGAALLLDVYHHLNVVPFSVRNDGLERAFITGGGYKYCQLGEGNGFLRFPADCELRPVVTGWFAEFGLLPGAGHGTVVDFPPGPDRFAGATYDPVSHYRGAAVFDFFAAQGLDPGFLRQVSQHQVGRLATGFDALALNPSVIARDRRIALGRRAGFLPLHSPRAADLVAGLHARGVACDARGDSLRLGPAPYLCDAQIDDALTALAEVTRSIG